ncbi:hypothetical protein BAUCODRAFT_202568 [Baudoinia panamericana UAMH 10762]|uniref:Endosomal peripheral membrane protein n=1 Tax=Baudoinia panamericana (strain UAMH 10762) TaxID=717646 RepID=M2M2A1_BAUPA|nr:uncharacterized protein BAUCODRAFT_202568 [Baudoinia panamericana UAMH 10762]EMD01228.1 hypothetical protein BAUCODRAFT_202568 [Baudoinia panamericana UAMH 10762]
MSQTLLASELTTLISEAKRKHGELKNAAEKSLQDLKALPSTSEQQLAGDLSRRPTFIDPFLIACETRIPKLAVSGLACLQRLVVSRALPRTRLKETLDAFNACSELGLDLQLKILQALPSLLQNYANELQDDLLASALQLCASLQSAKAQTVSGVAAATLQQLVAAVFEKVVDEDRKATDIAATHEVSGDNGPLMLRPAAFDAYRTFRDLVLAAEGRPTKFVLLSSLSPETSLEMIWSSLTANTRLFVSHSELSSIVRSNVIPTVTKCLSEKLSFSVTVRSLRIMDLLIGRHFNRFPGEFEVAIGLLTQNLDTDATAPWKRALAMEMIRNFFGNTGLIIEAYAAYDDAEDGKTVVQDLMSAFVRMSAEKPAVIGLGQESSVPIRQSLDKVPVAAEQLPEQIGSGMVRSMSIALGVAESGVAGISPQLSLPRLACLDQLDKAEPPTLPETYVYALVLECLTSLSESLARVVLPLTVRQDKDAPAQGGSGMSEEVNGNFPEKRPDRVVRSQSYQKRTVPINPLELEDGNVPTRVGTVANLVSTCWPAVLATSSTFLNASLEEQYYRNLIKSYQRFTQVAGLLRLKTPRDALMTTLCKCAVPAHILKAATADSARPPSTPVSESPRAASFMSLEGLVSQASSLSMDRDRRSSIEPLIPVLSTRNLLCLRALLNLAIALGPALDTAITLAVDVLRDADVILSSKGSQHWLRQMQTQKAKDASGAVHAFMAEITAVESAASRLLDSTVDYPNDSFRTVLQAFTRLLSRGREGAEPPSRTETVSPPATPTLARRSFSGLPGINPMVRMRERDYQFVIPKLGTLAKLNIARFVAFKPEESGWNILVEELIYLAASTSQPREPRRAATDVLCKMAAETVASTMSADEELRGVIQQRAMAVLQRLVEDLRAQDQEPTNVGSEAQGHVLEALRSILERCGETMVAGWSESIAMLSSAFKRTETSHSEGTDATKSWARVSSELVSPQIGRVAFASAQLVGADFLGALPDSVLPSLTELLYRFVAQTEDLNIALTAVTMTMSVADYLVNNEAAVGLDALAEQLGDSGLPPADLGTDATSSKSSQLLLLLLRLRTVVSETQKEVRNAAFQTICSILTNHGDKLSATAWDLLLRSVVLEVAADDRQLYNAEEQPDEGSYKSADASISQAIVFGVASLLAQHIRQIEQTKRLPILWETLLIRFEAYVDCHRPALSEAVYSGLSRILSHLPSGSPTWTTPANRALAMWLHGPPHDSVDVSKHEDNEGALTAYIETGVGLYRLTNRDIGPAQCRELIDNVYSCIRRANGPRYGGDVNSMSNLQIKAMSLLRGIRTDQPSVPSSLISTTARLCVLHHGQTEGETAANGPTFIAVSSEAIHWLQQLLHAHVGNTELVETGAILISIQSLSKVISDKYLHPAKHKDVSLWRRATSALLGLSLPLLNLTSDGSVAWETRLALWSMLVTVAAGIVGASGIDSMSDTNEVYEDEKFDIESFRKLRDVLVPRLSQTSLPDTIKIAYCRALFDASIVHATERGELPPPSGSPLYNIGNIRRGRAKRVPFARREEMSYVCFAELIALSSVEGSVALSHSAAPLLVLRLAIPIRAYIADQSLRGRSPQPMSELQELLHSFDQIKKLRLHHRALVADPVADGRAGSDAHLVYLYPLLVKAVAVAANKWYGADEVLIPLQGVLEAITPVR